MTRPAALALLALGCAAPAVKPAPGAGGAGDLVAVSRAMSAVDAAAAKGQLAAERQRLASAAEASPDDVVARFLAVYAAPRDEEAWNAFHALSDAHPASPWGSIGMARIYLVWNTPDQADGEIARALRLAPGNWIAVLLRGEAEERRDQAAEARADYAVVLRADPANPAAHVGMARLLRRAGDRDGASREAQAALAAAPEDHEALLLLGGIALDLGDRKRAVQWLERAAAAGPRDYEGRVRLARLEADLGLWRGAVTQWRAALEIREDAAGLGQLAQLARRAGDPAAETWALQRLTLIEPGPVEIWRRLAQLAVATRDAGGEETALTRVLERAPDDAQAHLELGRLLLARGDAERALRHFRAAGGAGRAERASLESRLNVEQVRRRDLRSLERAVGALIDRTYRARVRAVPGLGGMLGLRVTVDGSGAATFVEVTEDSVHDGDLRACAYWNLKDAAYPKRKPGRYAFRFALRPGR